MHSFSKPNSFIHGVCSVLPFYAAFAFQNCLLWSADTESVFEMPTRVISRRMRTNVLELCSPERPE